jgi:hypothetical protein
MFLSARVLAVMLAVPPQLLMPGIFTRDDVTRKAALLLLHNEWWSEVELLLSSWKGRVFVGLAAAQAGLLAISAMLSQRRMLALAGTAWRRYGLLTTTAVLMIALGEMLRLPATMGHVRYLGSCLAPASLIALVFADEEKEPAVVLHLTEPRFAVVRLDAGGGIAVVCLRLRPTWTGAASTPVRYQPYLLIAQYWKATGRIPDVAEYTRRALDLGGARSAEVRVALAENP